GGGGRVGGGGGEGGRVAGGRRAGAARRHRGGKKGPPAAPALQRDRRQYRAGPAVSRRARWTRGDHLRRARCGRLTVALVAVPSLDPGTAECVPARPVATRSGGRARPVVGWRIGAAIRVPAGQTVPAARARSHLARPPDGAS